MSWATQLDLVNVAVRNAFGEAVTYHPASGGAHALVAPFDRAHVEAELGNEIGVASTRPMLELRLADLPVVPAEGDTFTVGGVGYEVQQVRYDGRGGARLYATETE